MCFGQCDGTAGIPIIAGDRWAFLSNGGLGACWHSTPFDAPLAAHVSYSFGINGKINHRMFTQLHIFGGASIPALHTCCPCAKVVNNRGSLY